MFENIKYIVFKIEEIQKIDFELVMETSIHTIRLSKDETKSFVKWNTQDNPYFIQDLVYKEGPYTHEEIVEILSTPEWESPYV